jgi:16S rRNA (guanine527-N7)-methyltransferase
MVAGRSVEESLDSALRLAGADEIAPDIRDRIELYLEEVALWSDRMHLIGRNSIRRNLELLVLDSLLLLKVVEESELRRGTERACRVADIGSGAGFPGIVWKIFTPDLDMTLFERKMKPQFFLERMISRLGLEGVRVIGRDTAAFKEMGSFNLAVSKAAGRLDIILPLAEKLLIPGGAYVTIKGRAWRDELPAPDQGGIRLDSMRELPEKRGVALIFRKR